MKQSHITDIAKSVKSLMVSKFAADEPRTDYSFWDDKPAAQSSKPVAPQPTQPSNPVATKPVSPPAPSMDRESLQALNQRRGIPTQPPPSPAPVPRTPEQEHAVRERQTLYRQNNPQGPGPDPVMKNPFNLLTDPMARTAFGIANSFPGMRSALGNADLGSNGQPAPTAPPEAKPALQRVGETARHFTDWAIGPSTNRPAGGGGQAPQEPQKPFTERMGNSMRSGWDSLQRGWNNPSSTETTPKT